MSTAEKDAERHAQYRAALLAQGVPLDEVKLYVSSYIQSEGLMRASEQGEILNDAPTGPRLLKEPE